jgi:hypothetical protein
MPKRGNEIVAPITVGIKGRTEQRKDSYRHRAVICAEMAHEPDVEHEWDNPREELRR